MNAHTLRLLTRRYFLHESAMGLGAMALGSMLPASDRARAADAVSSHRPANSIPPHFAPKAKHIIFLFMAGGPSQLDLFDPKPALARYEDQPVPDEVLKGADLPFIERDAALMASPFKFARHGQSGAILSPECC